MLRFKPRREDYIPTGALKIADKHSTAIAYTYCDRAERPNAVVFVGQQSKPVLFCSYRSEAARANAVRQAFEAAQSHAAAVADRRTSRTAANSLDVGDVLATCWGYEQTNREFFEVIECCGKHVILREIAQDRYETAHDRSGASPSRRSRTRTPPISAAWCVRACRNEARSAATRSNTTPWMRTAAPSPCRSRSATRCGYIGALTRVSASGSAPSATTATSSPSPTFLKRVSPFARRRGGRVRSSGGGSRCGPSDRPRDPDWRARHQGRPLIVGAPEHAERHELERTLRRHDRLGRLRHIGAGLDRRCCHWRRRRSTPAINQAGADPMPPRQVPHARARLPRCRDDPPPEYGVMGAPTLANNLDPRL